MPDSIQRISVIVPDNPFLSHDLGQKKHCLCALDVEKLLKWWPGTPHIPHRNAKKVQSIQRSLDWKRVTKIAAYLLQEEIIDAPDKLDKYFKDFYEPKKEEPGREWPPKVGRVVGYERSEYRVFSNVLLHVNGATIDEIPAVKGAEGRQAKLHFDENDPALNFTVIDGQHRINGAYLAIKILQESKPAAKWELPAEVFLDLDPPSSAPKLQAQIFIDVNFYQKKVDRSLVADLFPTARGSRTSLDNKERAEDIGRRLMLDVGPLVGMIQIPGIRYGVRDVITLSTLNSAVEDVLDILIQEGVSDLEGQTAFIAQSLQAWFEASGRFQRDGGSKSSSIDPSNVVYQGRVLVSVISVIPALIYRLHRKRLPLISDKSHLELREFLRAIADNAGLLVDGRFIDKSEFRSRGFLGSGGIARFRDLLWAASAKKLTRRQSSDMIQRLANSERQKVLAGLEKGGSKR